jgi:hypothetical protein
MSELLRSACEACVTDKGIKNDELVQRLHDYVHENYEETGKPWNYTLLDSLIDEWSKEVEFRELDGVYFRVKRNDKWQNICFSDLTETEMDEMLNGRNEEWLKSLCKILGQTLRRIGDMFDIRTGEE